MKTLRKIIPFFILLLTACSPITLHMNIDPQLDKNSEIYPVKFNTEWSRYYRDFSFGSYHVKKTSNLTTTLLNKDITNPDLFNYFIFHEKGIVTSKLVKAHDYEFEQDSKIPWLSNCVYVVEKKETQYSNFNTAEEYFARYVCTYTRKNNQPWYLSITTDYNDKVVMTMTDKKTLYLATPTLGDYYKANGNKSDFSAYAGYTWMRDNTKIAAVSTEEEKPKVWLSKQNTEELNSIISMASAGLLLYDSIVSDSE